jgi:hypothetical protein
MNPGALRCFVLLAAAALAGGCDSSAAVATRPAHHAAAPAVVPAHVPPPLPAAPAPQGGAEITNVFAATSWQPAPAPAPPAPAAAAAAAALAPVAPAAPPLPFRFIGRYGDGASHLVMLVKGDKLYLVAPGDTIDDAYRVDRVTGTTIELTYLPLKLTQSLSTGDAG